MEKKGYYSEQGGGFSNPTKYSKYAKKGQKETYAEKGSS